MKASRSSGFFTGLLLVSVLTGGALGILVGRSHDEGRERNPGEERSLQAEIERRELLQAEERRAILAALERIESGLAARERIAVASENVHADVPRTAPVGSELDVARELAELRAAIEALDRARGMAELQALDRELGRDRSTGVVFSLSEVASMDREQLARGVRWRSFEEIQSMFGAPARSIAQGTQLTWEFDCPGGEMLGVRFVDGRAVDAWD